MSTNTNSETSNTVISIKLNSKNQPILKIDNNDNFKDESLAILMYHICNNGENFDTLLTDQLRKKLETSNIESKKNIIKIFNEYNKIKLIKNIEVPILPPTNTFVG